MIAGHVPSEITQTISSFLHVCYIACRADLDQAALKAFDIALSKFYALQEVFHTSGVRPTGFSLPRQHSLTHYHHLIKEFGAPRGVCSSITESQHITAVKKPWCCSSCYQALGQMLVTDQWLDKLAAARVDFISCGMLDPKIPQHPGMVLVPMARKENQSGDEDEIEEGEHPEADPSGSVGVPMVTGNVTLAQTCSMFLFLSVRPSYLIKFFL